MRYAGRRNLLAGAILLFPVAAWAQHHDRLKYADLLSVENLPADYFSFEPGETYLKPRESVWLDAANWAVDQHEAQSSRIEQLGLWLDRTLGGASTIRQRNASFMRVGLATRWESSGVVDLEPDLRFRLDLPTLKEKLRLVIESDQEEKRSLGELDSERRLTRTERSADNITAALRFLGDVTDNWHFSTDLGAKLGTTPKLFWRARASTNWQLSDVWQMNFDQRIYYFTSDGAGARSGLGFSRDLTDGWKFLASSQARWIEEDSNIELSQILQTDKILNSRTLLTVRTGVLADSRRNVRVSEYFADVTYRYRLYNTWLYGEVIPALQFLREDHFRDTPSITFRIEAFFSGQFERD